MKKTTLLNTAIAATLIAGSASVIAATHTGDLGDSRIHFPLNDATITEAATDIWFVAALDADFYTLDLRAYDPASGGCGHMKTTGEGANTTHIKKMFSTHDVSLQCGEEIVGTAPVTGYYDKNDGDIESKDDEDGEADFHLCKWRTPDLPNGNYQIAVNSIKLGYHSITETRFNCQDKEGRLANLAAEIVVLSGNPTGTLVFHGMTEGVNGALYALGEPDLVGHTDVPLAVGDSYSNKHRDPSSYSYSPFSASSLLDKDQKAALIGLAKNEASISDAADLISALKDIATGLVDSDSVLPEDGGDRNYQTFKIAVPENPPEEVTIVDHPMDPIVIYPVHETSITGDEDDADSRVEFLDPSPANRAADWYELWISKDDTNERLMDIESNPEYNNWYKLIVDSSELLCTQRAGDNGRICTIEIVSPTIQAALTSDKFNWWVRGWNEEFQEEETEDGNGWSDKGTFTGSKAP